MRAPLDTTVPGEYSDSDVLSDSPHMHPLVSLALEHDEDVVAARRCAAQLAALLEFDVAEQTRIATAVSEIVRNAFRYASGGIVHFELALDSRPQQVVVRIEDHGPGIANLDEVLGGRFQSSTGMGLGIVGARRLMDSFSVESTPQGTCVVLAKSLPAHASVVTTKRADEIAAGIRKRPRRGLLDELQQQNEELLRALADVEHKQQELTRLNRELEDTNRGVVALYAELDERADHLRRADDLKSRFLSNMTHEFRTPVNAITGLCNLLIEERQHEGRPPEPELDFILKAADQLSSLVNDLLDIAKVEAGRTEVRAAPCEVKNLFGALRGMLRPLLLTQSVTLVFEDAEGLPAMHTDEAKVSHILRNLISNGLKFTERGEVRISAAFEAATGMMMFRVADTGIGIAAENQSIVFEEFGQVEHRLQRKVRGTGLGLPLSRRLAELLGGFLTLESEPDVGSVFTAAIPATYAGLRAAPPEVSWTIEPGKLPLIIVQSTDAPLGDDIALEGSRFQPVHARSIADAEAALESIAPAAIVLEIAGDADDPWDFLIRLKRDRRTNHVPVVVASVAAAREKALALGADAFLVRPIDASTLLGTLDGLQSRMSTVIRVLAIDDEESARYMVRRCLPLPAFEVLEASDAAEGLRCARVEAPDVIVLDLVMPVTSGWDLLSKLRGDPLTSHIPVVIATGADLGDADRRGLAGDAAAILMKSDISRHTLPDILRTALGRAL
ncbi:MAG: hypothetical protein V7647_3145 [Acidobacteriota bacterium]